MPKQHHVVPNPKGGWDIKIDNGKKSIQHFDNKEDAVHRAREISKHEKTELIIHGKDGKIQQSDSHGHDPSNVKG
ncbi:MAG: DUF2188 domain-containing protein [Deltaproteobacteria bacterium]|jgi:uncharacterized protein YdaT|nr:DUF2188 domain-containing protein [Deltaproteobacteria bacterium]